MTFTIIEYSSLLIIIFRIYSFNLKSHNLIQIFYCAQLFCKLEVEVTLPNYKFTKNSPMQ